MIDLISYVSFVGSGIILTMSLLLCGISIGMVGGIFFAILRYKKIAIVVINRVISILRGTPLILQLSFIYFSTPGLIGIKLSVLTAGIITFGLNSAAYLAEIIRSGIESLPPGQFEAAKTLKISNFYMWKDIILPQVISNVFPGLVNEVIALLKETALISTIGGMDIMRKAEILAAEQFTYFLPLCIAGCYYYGLVIVIELLGKKIEQRKQHVKT